MKKLLCLTMATLLMAGLALLVYAAAPDKVVIDGIKDKKGAVEFPHKVHADTHDCKTCHHMYDGTGDPAKCTSCHTAEGKDDAPKGFKAFHDRKAENSCIGCHSKTEGSGPTKCNDCHPKE
jgi:hypothetical protein